MQALKTFILTRLIMSNYNGISSIAAPKLVFFNFNLGGELCSMVSTARYWSNKCFKYVRKANIRLHTRLDGRTNFRRFLGKPKNCNTKKSPI